MPEYASDAYDIKVLFCGDYAISKSYSLPVVLGRSKSSDCKKNFTDFSARSPKRYDNINRARDTVSSLIYCNLTPHTKFLTLTTSTPVLDVSLFMRKLTTFFQYMRRHSYDLDYLYVLERQLRRGKKESNSGSLHAHIVIFNDEIIPIDLLRKAWPHGFVKINVLNGLRCSDSSSTPEAINNLASYVCKYITKESVAEWNEKCFRTSKGLKRPIETLGKGYLTPRSYYRSEECEALRQTLFEDFTCIYNSCKKAEYTTSEGHRTNFITTSVSVKKIP
jgi:hypothetical protein